MRPTIKFEAQSDAALPLSRELLCTVWALDFRSEESPGAEPILEGHPILVGSASSRPEESEISLPTPGNYLVDLKFPNGRRTRRAVSVDAHPGVDGSPGESFTLPRWTPPSGRQGPSGYTGPRVAPSSAGSL